MIFALVGNQNCGKTTLFNALTGSNQHVGNFPGVTVDQKVGEIRGRKDCEVADLPGIYSLRPYTAEEVVSRDYILKNRPDGIINIVDATNIERNLYLSLQLLELRIPTVIAVNMMDELTENGGSIDVRGLSEELGVPVIPIAAIRNEGISDLIDTAVNAVSKNLRPAVYDFCGNDSQVHRCIHAVVHLIQDHADRIRVSSRFCTSKLIEGDSDMEELLGLDRNEQEMIEHCILQMEAETGLERNEALADMRYQFIEKTVAKTVKKPRESREHIRSSKIDRVLTGKYTAIPAFLLIMGLIFYLTFNVIGARLQDILAAGIDLLSGLADRGLTSYGINPVVRSLVIDGIFSGVGSVVSFLPVIVVMFFFLSILEDTGYMARIAFFMDRLLRKIGLSGKSFVPLLVGFGCSVPAIMATRTSSSERDRKMTILLTPFMSCSAKIPIYSVFVAAFFGKFSGLAMVCIYLLGILAGILVATVLRFTFFKGEPVPFVMELPNYRLPSARSTGLLLWEKARDFLEKAFTIILLATVIIWFLRSFDSRLNVVTDSSLSLLALIGRLLAPVFKPLGFGDWKMVASLITGITAKEAVVSTMAVVMETSMEDLKQVLSSVFTARSASAFLAFTLLYTPCSAAIAAIRREFGSPWKAALIVLFQCAVAWLVGALVYQIGGLFL